MGVSINNAMLKRFKKIRLKKTKEYLVSFKKRKITTWCKNFKWWTYSIDPKWKYYETFVLRSILVFCPLSGWLILKIKVQMRSSCIMKDVNGGFCFKPSPYLEAYGGISRNILGGKIFLLGTCGFIIDSKDFPIRKYIGLHSVLVFCFILYAIVKWLKLQGLNWTYSKECFLSLSIFKIFQTWYIYSWSCCSVFFSRWYDLFFSSERASGHEARNLAALIFFEGIYINIKSPSMPYYLYGFVLPAHFNLISFPKF